MYRRSHAGLPAAGQPLPQTRPMTSATEQLLGWRVASCPGSSTQCLTKSALAHGTASTPSSKMRELRLKEAEQLPSAA